MCAGFCFLEQNLGADFRDFRRQHLKAILLDGNTLFSTYSEGVSGNVGVYLVAHVGLQVVLGADLAPGCFHFDDTDTMKRTILIPILSGYMRQLPLYIPTAYRIRYTHRVDVLRLLR